MPTKQQSAPQWVSIRNRIRFFDEILQTSSAILSLAALASAAYLLYRLSSQQFQSLQGTNLYLVVLIAGVLGMIGLHYLVMIYLRQLQRKAERYTQHDGIQPVYDWDGFHQVLRREIRRGGRYHLPVTLCLLSVDDLHLLMHRQGRGFSDKLLGRFVELLIGLIRSSDYLAQLSENEFCILLCHTDLANAEKFLFRALLQAQERLEISFSAGLTIFRAGENPLEFLRRVRQALEQARHEGQKKIHCAIGKDDSQVIKSF